MPAIIAKLIPIAVVALIGYWFIKEMEAADQRRDELKNHWFWRFLWPLVNWWLEVKRTRSYTLWLFRAAIFVGVLYLIVRWMSSR
jgi:uncharacterized membrane protein